MASPYLKIPVEELRAASARFQQQKGDLEGTLATMQQQISSLEGDWTGAAQQAFLTLMSQWTTDYNNMVSVLERVKQLLDAAATGFGDQDQQFANVLNQIMGS